MLLSFLLLSILPFSFSLDCYPPPRRGQLPILNHCNDLVHALILSARLPRHNEAKTWGRGLPSSTRTEHLPKVYWLPGRGPQTCALHLDVDPLYPDATEVFNLEAIGIAAARIVNLCLVQRRQLGRDSLGRTGRVVGKIVRTDSPIQTKAPEEGVQSVMVPGVGKLAWASGRRNGSLDDDVR